MNKGADPYFKGKKLYGDDFSEVEIKKWYKQEEEGYSSLLKETNKEYVYEYHSLNFYYGFQYLKDIERFTNVLGIGSAFGEEFLPIITKIEKLTILEPSENLRSQNLHGIKPTYVKPSINGSMPFPDNSFDLVTCFGTLHHIPNVSFVLGEIIRVLKPNGLLLLREPIRSMGDWRFPRKGLTKNERGIPHKYFDDFFDHHGAAVLKKSFCESLFAYRILKRLFKVNFNSRFYPVVDHLISKLFQWNITYHPTTSFQKIAPGSVFYIAKKKV